VTRRRLLLVVLAGLLALGVGVWLLWPESAINAGNFAKIRVGMTLTEVESLLRGPERDDSSGPVEVLFDEHIAVAVVDDVPGQTGPGAQDSPKLPRVWTSDRLVIRLWLDTDGRVISGHAAPVRRFQDSLVDRVRRRIGV
jgi:hypothetical protein